MNVKNVYSFIGENSGKLDIRVATNITYVRSTNERTVVRSGEPSSLCVTTKAGLGCPPPTQA